MNDNIQSEERGLALASPIVAEVSPYDETYPITLLTNGLKNRLDQAQVVAKEIYGIVAKGSPVLTQIQKSLKKGYRYVVDAEGKNLDSVRLVTSKTGKIYAQIRKANG